MDNGDKSLYMLPAELIAITLSQVENKYGIFFKCQLMDKDRVYPESYARSPNRALAFALRKLADSLIEDSYG